MTNSYVAGIATVDMTPPVGTPLAGFTGRGFHSSTGVYHPLRAVALSLEDGDTDVVVVAVELEGCYDDFADRVAGQIAARLGLARRHVLINASHTHCGPALQESDVHHHGRIDREYREQLVDTLVTVAERAHAHRFPATVERAVGHCDFAVNRRRPDSDRPDRVGRAMRPNPDGPTDHDVPVLVVSSADDGVVRAVVASYACHPTSRGGLRIGGDFVGFALDAIEEAFPFAQPMFLQGCAGDQKPGPTDPAATVFDTRSVPQVAELGAALAQAVTTAMTHRVRVDGPLRAGFGAVTVRAEAATDAQVSEALVSALPYEQEWARHWQHILAEGGTPFSETELELQVVAFGDDLVLVGQGGEMTVEHGLRLKRDLSDRFSQVVPLGYSNTMIGYVPVARQFEEYGYEVRDANLMCRWSGRWERDTEDRIHAAIGQLVDDLG